MSQEKSKDESFFQDDFLGGRRNRLVTKAIPSNSTNVHHIHHHVECNGAIDRWGSLCVLARKINSTKLLINKYSKELLPKNCMGGVRPF